jgi:hypothetical protein
LNGFHGLICFDLVVIEYKNAALTMTERIDDEQAARIAQRLEDSGDVLREARSGYPATPLILWGETLFLP